MKYLEMNYQLELEKIMNNPQNRGKKLLLHSCCAPCSSYVLVYLSTFFDISFSSEVISLSVSLKAFAIAFCSSIVGTIIEKFENVVLFIIGTAVDVLLK